MGSKVTLKRREQRKRQLKSITPIADELMKQHNEVCLKRAEASYERMFGKPDVVIETIVTPIPAPEPFYPWIKCVDKVKYPKLSPFKDVTIEQQMADFKSCGQPSAKKKEEQIMRTETEIQRDHLTSRLYKISFKNIKDLSNTFHIADDAAPATATEWLQRVTEGKFEWRNVGSDKLNDKDFWEYRTPSDYIRWRDPAVKADQAGYNAAKVRLDDAQTKTLDDISILTPVDALASLRTFEETDFSTTTTA